MKGVELRAARARLGLSREMVAGRFGIQTRAVARIEDENRDVFDDIAAFIRECDDTYQDVFVETLHCAGDMAEVVLLLPRPSTDLEDRIATMAVSAAGVVLTAEGVEVDFGYAM